MDLRRECDTKRLEARTHRSIFHRLQNLYVAVHCRFLTIEIRDGAGVGNAITLTRAGVPISATTIDRYAAELERLEGERAALRETIARFWAHIARMDPQ
jgi:hypothetical protein